jgi:hypothetical protein
MDITLGGVAFFCLIAAHLLAVVAVHRARRKGETREPVNSPTKPPSATGIFFTLAILAVTGLSSVQAGSNPDGQYAASPVKPWLQSLKSGKGSCCSATAGVAIADVGWESLNGHYRVRVEGAWRDVPADAVIAEPNHAGRTMVWPIYTWGLDGLERVEIQCFLPGGMM